MEPSPELWFAPQQRRRIPRSCVRRIVVVVSPVGVGEKVRVGDEGVRRPRDSGETAQERERESKTEREVEGEAGRGRERGRGRVESEREGVVEREGKRRSEKRE